MVLGLGIGFSLDNWLGTAPIMIVVMSLFGFGAGVRTMMRTAAEYSSVQPGVTINERNRFEG